MYSTRKIVRSKEHSFCLFPNMCKLPISINTFFQWYHFLLKLRIFVNVKFQNTKSDARVMSIYAWLPVMISFIRIFVPFLYCHNLWSFFWIFVFVCLLLFLLSFSFVFILGKILSAVLKIEPLWHPLLSWLQGQ